MTAWTDHVKKWAKENNKTYGCAISDPRCKASYRSGDVASAREKVVESVQKIRRIPSQFEPINFSNIADIEEMIEQSGNIEKYERDPSAFRSSRNGDLRTPSHKRAQETLASLKRKLENDSTREVIELAKRFVDFRFDYGRQKPASNFKLREVEPSSQNVYARGLRQAEQEAKAKAEADAKKARMAEARKAKAKERKSSSNAPNPSDQFNFV